MDSVSRTDLIYKIRNIFIFKNDNIEYNQYFYDNTNIKEYLKKNDINEYDKNYNTLLYGAIWYKKIKIIKLLLKQSNLDINRTIYLNGKSTQNVLHAVHMIDGVKLKYKILKLLIKHKIDINSEFIYGSIIDNIHKHNILPTLLYYNYNYNERNIKIIKLLLKNGINYDVVSYNSSRKYNNILDCCKNYIIFDKIRKIIIQQYIKDGNNNYITYIKNNNKLKVYYINNFYLI